MASDKKISVAMAKPTEKKRVFRYDAPKGSPAPQNIYVDKAALKKLGNPKRITVTIEAA